MLRRRLAVGWLLFRALLLSRRAIAAPPCAPGALPAAWIPWRTPYRSSGRPEPGGRCPGSGRERSL